MTNDNINSIIKYVIFAGLWVVLLIPFLVANQMFFPFITGKNFVFRVIVEIIFAFWIYLAFVDVKYRPKLSWVLGSVGLFVFVMAVADIFAVAPMKAFWSNFERMDGWITLIHLLMYLLVFGTVMKTEKIWLWFFRSSLAVSLVMTAFVAKEWLSTGATRVSVTLGNPIYVAVYFLFNFFFALILLYKDVIAKKTESLKQLKEISKNYLTYIYLILATLCVWGIWRTSTRGVILGLIGGLFVASIIIAIFEKKNRLMRNFAFGGLITIVIIVAGFFAIKDTQFVKNNVTLSRLASISWKDVKGQGQARQYVWGMALQGFKEKPVLGWGQEGFNYVFNKYYDERMYDQEQWFDRAHDTPLDVLIAGGALGLISYLAIFASALWLIWKRKENLGVTDAALLVGVLAGYFFQNIFVFDNLTSYIFFFVVLSYLHSIDTESVIELSTKDNIKRGISEDLAHYVIAPILIVTLGASLWYFNTRPMNANSNLLQALREIGNKNPDYSKSLELFKKAISYRTFANSEILEQLIAVTPQIINKDGVSQELKQEFAGLAFSEIKRQTATVPNDARYQFFAGIFLNNLGEYQLALPYLEKALELSPKKLTMMFELIKTFSYLGEKDKALEIAEKAYNLVPEYNDAKINYIATAILNKDDTIVEKLMGNSTTSDERIVRAYLLNASEFLQKNDKGSAVWEVEKAIKIAPGFKVQGEQVINGIWNGTIK